jgi:hypothetical protein
LFEKIPINQAFLHHDSLPKESAQPKQLQLLDF